MAVAVKEGVIVWEYLADLSGLYTPYPDRVSNYIDEEFAKNPGKVIKLKDADPLLKSYEVDFAAMKQIATSNGSLRDIRRQIYDIQSTIGNGVVWEWLTDLGWVTYDYEALNAIEDAFANNQAELDLATLTHKLPNIVLIEKGYQRNKSSGFVRPVQRRVCAYKSNVKKRVPAKRRTKDARSMHHNAAGPPNVSLPPTSKNKSSTGKDSRHLHISKYCTVVQDIPSNDDCPICLVTLKDDDDTSNVVDEIVQLKKCKHMFHESCMEAYCKQGQQNGCIQCPICKKIHGTKIGNQPPGDMRVSKDMRQSVAGYEGCGMITISYDISNGVQGANHPSRGQPYVTYGFPRTGYLPANEEGNKVLKLLSKAWKRKLIFTVGTSSTTGLNNSVIWNEIHHKTSPRNNLGGHGYPDPKYLENVTEELKQHGVTEDDSDDDDDENEQ